MPEHQICTIVKPYWFPEVGRGWQRCMELVIIRKAVAIERVVLDYLIKGLSVENEEDWP